jgi:hypothetical protein
MIKLARTRAAGLMKATGRKVAGGTVGIALACCAGHCGSDDGETGGQAPADGGDSSTRDAAGEAASDVLATGDGVGGDAPQDRSVSDGPVADVGRSEGGEAGATDGSMSGMQIFPADHIWNTRIDGMPVDSQSGDYIDRIGASSYLGIYNGIPFNVVDDTVIHQNVSLTRPWSDFIPYPIPDNPLIEPGGTDKHMLIVDRDEGILYELYHAQRDSSKGTWSAQSGFSFNLSSYALRPAGYTTADAAGLAIFPGLVRYDEVRSGAIHHAIRFTVPASANSYVWPARAPGSGGTDNTFPPNGQRFRLKASLDLSGYPPQAKTILEALKTYGMMVSDNSGDTGVFSIVFAPDAGWDNDDLGNLFQVHGSDFEAVNVTSLMIDKDSGQARIPPNGG